MFMVLTTDYVSMNACFVEELLPPAPVQERQKTSLCLVYNGHCGSLSRNDTYFVISMEETATDCPFETH